MPKTNNHAKSGMTSCVASFKGRVLRCCNLPVTGHSEHHGGTNAPDDGKSRRQQNIGRRCHHTNDRADACRIIEIHARSVAKDAPSRDPRRVEAKEDQHWIEGADPHRSPEFVPGCGQEDRENDNADHGRANHPEDGEQAGKSGDRQHDLPEFVLQLYESHARSYRLPRGRLKIAMSAVGTSWTSHSLAAGSMGIMAPESKQGKPIERSHGHHGHQ